MTLPRSTILEWALVLVFFLLGSWLRLYHLPNTLLFLGDQGRDALIAKQILINHDPALIGPVTSVGNMYLGPFYYYFMVPFLALTYPNPIGPAYGVAIINCLSLLGIYLIARKFFGKAVGVISIFLYAFMPLSVVYSRFSWNPNLGSPIGLMLFYCLIQWYQSKQWKYVFGSGILLGIIIQLHYVALVTFAVAGFIWLLLIFKSSNKERFIIIQQALVMGLLIALLISPLVIFDFRHQHIISQQFTSFFTSKEEHIQPVTKITRIISETEGRMYRLLVQTLNGIQWLPYAKWLGYGSIISYIILLVKKQFSSKEQPIIISMLVWLGATIVGTAFYSSSIFDHYLTFCFPIVILFWSLLIVKLWRMHWMTKPVSVALILIIVLLYQQKLTKLQFSGVGTERIQQTVQTILPHITAPYNLALIAANGDYQGMNYRYYFAVSNNPPQNNESYHELKTLVVIDETHQGNPLSVPAYEIQAPHLTLLRQEIDIPDGPHVFIYQ